MSKLKNDPDSQPLTAATGGKVLLRKRHYQLESIDDDPMPAKRPKTSPPPPPELNDDCWLEVFAYLDILALSNVAKCNSHFKFLAHNVFQRVHRYEMEIVLGKKPWFSILDLKGILSEFGTYATDLKLNSDPDETLKPLASDYITMFMCKLIKDRIDPNQLTCLHIGFWPLIPNQVATFQKLIECYPNLQTLSLDMSKTPRAVQFGDFVKCLPNLENFRVCGDVFISWTLGRSWPSLNELAIFGNATVTRHQMQSILQLNPQIVALTIHTPNAYSTLNEFIDDLVGYGFDEQLTKLRFYEPATQPYTFRESIVLFQCLESLCIHSRTFEPSVANARLISKLTNLQKLSLRLRKDQNDDARAQVQFNWEFLQILGKSLVNLRIVNMIGYNIENTDWVNFVALLPKACKATCSVSDLYILID